MQGALQIALMLAGAFAESCMSLHRLQRARVVGTAVKYTDVVLSATLHALQNAPGERQLPPHSSLHKFPKAS